MLEAFARSSDITVRQITVADWQLFRDFYKGMAYPQHNSVFLSGRNLDSPETYRDLFAAYDSEGPYVYFALCDGDRMIGQTLIKFRKNGDQTEAYFTGTEITEAYRGRHLTDKLYETRMEYLRRINFDGPVSMAIESNNIASQKAAVRNGFIRTGELDGNGFDILVPATMR